MVCKGDCQWVVWFFDAFGDERLDQWVGLYWIEVQELLYCVRLVCDGDEYGIGFDLIWEGSFLVVQEPQHLIRFGAKTIFDILRFVQVGMWQGVLCVDGTEHIVFDWVGIWDCLWGIRFVGDFDLVGRPPVEFIQGFWWLYVLLRFDDFAVVVIVQENPDGFRIFNDVVWVWFDGRVEQFGWPRVEIGYCFGMRYLEWAILYLSIVDGKLLLIEIETLIGVVFNVGCGYGGDLDWVHGQWKGENFVEGAKYDFIDLSIAVWMFYSVIDYVVWVMCDGVEGWGFFEYVTFGCHDFFWFQRLGGSSFVSHDARRVGFRIFGVVRVVFSDESGGLDR